MNFKTLGVDLIWLLTLFVAGVSCSSDAGRLPVGWNGVSGDLIAQDGIMDGGAGDLRLDRGAELSDAAEDVLPDGVLDVEVLWDLQDDVQDNQGEDLAILPDCSPWVTAKATCSFNLIADPDGCPTTECRDAPCEGGGDCPSSQVCVQGNCVDCWNDDQCDGGTVCRGGRCVVVDESQCMQLASSCAGDGCATVQISEMPCYTCSCDSIFNKSCESDWDCQVLSSHPYSRCVYGRCAECRDDADCGWGRCSPPGLCFTTEPSAEVLYGSWVIGWSGGMDHYSYFRFEPDGTLRRAPYEPEGPFSDDIYGVWCEEVPGGGQGFGFWEPIMTESGYLVIHVHLDFLCGTSLDVRLLVTVTGEDKPVVNFSDIDLDDAGELIGFRVPVSYCDAGFTACQSPDGDIFGWVY